MLHIVQGSQPAPVIDLATTLGGWVTILCSRVVAQMAREGVVDPLSQPVTVAAFIADLHAAAGVPAPQAVADLIGG